MKTRSFCLALILLIAALSLAATLTAQEPASPVLKTEVHLIDFTYSAQRTGGALARGLTQEDFHVYEDGVAQKIAFFGREDDLPLTLGLVVDASDSQSKFFKRHRKDIRKFLSSVVQPRDQVFAICFGNHLRLTSDLISSTDAVMDGLERFDKGDRHFPELAMDDKREGGTALYDAVYHSINERMAQAHQRRRALILFTDGEENASAHDLLDAIDAARDADTLVYAIRYTDEKESGSAYSRQGMAALHHLAAETGGADFDALNTDLGEVFRQIAEELRSLYSLAYHSTNHSRDGQFHRVQIVPKDAALTVRARTGYYAK